MNVNNSSVNTYNPYAKVQNQEQENNLRQFTTGIAKKNSVEDQIEIYAKTTQNANEQYKNTNEVNSTQNEYYNEFMQDVQKTQNYETYLNNGGDISKFQDIKNYPSVQPLPKDLTEEQRDMLRQTATDLAKRNSIESQIDAYKIGSDTSTSDYIETQSYVQNYNDFAKDARRAEYLNIYMSSN